MTERSVAILWLMLGVFLVTAALAAPGQQLLTSCVGGGLIGWNIVKVFTG